MTAGKALPPRTPSTKIKFCGLTSLEDIRLANQLRPDYVGFVGTPKSSRYVSPAKALALRQALDPSIPVVGVFQDQSLEEVEEYFLKGAVNLIQCHGEEDPIYVEQLQKRFPQGKDTVIKAFKISGPHSMQKAQDWPYQPLLLDGGAGEGKVFDWTLLREMKKIYFLAGGLTPENVKQVVARFHPYGVDVSSGIETNGKKDYEKMIAFMQAVREGETL